MWSWILTHIFGAVGAPEPGTQIGGWVDVAMSVVGTFALIAAMTPNKTDDKVAGFLRTLVDLLGANFGKARNQPPK